MTSSAYRKPAPDPGLDALGELLQGLRERGMSVGVDDAARVATAFRHAHAWSREKRVRMLKALLARSDAERLLIDQLAQFLFVEAPREALPDVSTQPQASGPDAPLVEPVPQEVEPGPRPRSWAGRWVVVAAAAALVVVGLSVWTYGRSGPHGVQSARVSSASVPTAASASTVASALTADPASTAHQGPEPPPRTELAFNPVCPRQPDRAAEWRRLAVAASVLFAFGVAGWLLGLVWRDRRGRRQAHNVQRVAASTGPRVYVLDVPHAQPLYPLEPSLARDAAFQLSAPRTEVSAEWIDAGGTVHDTVQNMGLVSLRFDRWKEQAPILVLEDVATSMVKWPLHAAQLVDAIERQGGQVTRYFFDREPADVYKDRSLTQPIELDRALCANPQATVVVVSDASGVEPARGSGPPWLGLLSSCLWLHPAPEALWGRGARWLGARLRVVAMSPEGLLRLGGAGFRPREGLQPAWQPPEMASGDPRAVVCAWRGALSAPGATRADQSAFWLLCAGALLSQRAGLTVRLLIALREEVIDAPWHLAERIWRFPTLGVGNDGTIQMSRALGESLVHVLRTEQPELTERVVDWAKNLATATSRDLEPGSLAELAARVTHMRLDAESQTRREQALKKARELAAQGFGDVITGYTSESERKDWCVPGLRRVRRPTNVQWVTAATLMVGGLILSGTHTRVSQKLWPSVPRFLVLTPIGSTSIGEHGHAAVSLLPSHRPDICLCDALWLDSKLAVWVNGASKPGLVAAQGVWDVGALLAELVPAAGSRQVEVEFGYDRGKRFGATVELRAPPEIPVSEVHPPPPQLKGARMVRIPAGTFQMGSNDGDEDEKPVHAVTLPSFEMDVTEVTVAEYKDCVAAKACQPAFATVSWPGMKPEDEKTWSPFCNWGRKGRELHPINCVDWNQARAYCRWAGKRLPTEEEWEYAARGTDGRKYPWGDGAPGPDRLNACGTECVAMLKEKGLTWTAMYAGSDGYPDTAPVGSFPKGKSPFDVLDMAGNVWEWTETEYCDSYAVSKKCATARVDRGGSWINNNPSNVRAPTRGHDGAPHRFLSVGFRCAR
ncbi:MAG: SUMF1/EgtB/PvdO family nonheme iron enzyme [Polyangiaceae bacterium]|nr:SUMF1/EgtB/PvdO family nonheme iron enzyme [Polyangiaceae bacterium]